jgi:hypothetical protein
VGTVFQLVDFDKSWRLHSSFFWANWVQIAGESALLNFARFFARFFKWANFSPGFQTGEFFAQSEFSLLKLQAKFQKFDRAKMSAKFRSTIWQKFGSNNRISNDFWAGENLGRFGARKIITVFIFEF